MIPTAGRLLALDWGERPDRPRALATNPRSSPPRSRRSRAGRASASPCRGSSSCVAAARAGGRRGGAAAHARGRRRARARWRPGSWPAADRPAHRLPVELWDERMSTARALAAIREQGGSTRGRKEDVDALAAAVLLQHFLDARQRRRRRRRTERGGERRRVATALAVLAAIALLAACAGGNSAPRARHASAGRHLRRGHRQPRGPPGGRPARASFKLLARVRGVDRSVQAGVYEFPAGHRRPGRCSTCWPRAAAVSQVHGARGPHHPGGRGARGRAARYRRGFGARRRARRRRRHRAARLHGAVVRGVPPARDLLAAARRAARASWCGSWPRVQGRLEAGLERAARLPADDPAAARHPRVDRRGRGPGRRRAGDHRRGVPQPAADRHGAAGRSDRAVRHHARHRQRESRGCTQKDYQFPSPYNTYLHPGLPPGPVNSPSRRSIEASLYPAKVPYLYFVAGPDGRHVFARTYAEHLRNIARGRAEEREQLSAPRSRRAAPTASA